MARKIKRLRRRRPVTAYVGPRYDLSNAWFEQEDPNAEFVNRQQQYLSAEEIDQALGIHGLSPQTVKTVPEVTPTEKVDVTSTFETRPINAQDFFKSGGTLVQSTTTLLDDTETGTFSFIIPSGFVAVLRSFAWEFEPVYTQNTIITATTGLTIDGAAVKFLDVFNDLQITTSRPVQTHVIVDENQTLEIRSVRISNIAFAARGIPVPDYVATFTGNLLQKRNLPANFEVGSFT